jgi:hypothetical protein
MITRLQIFAAILLLGSAAAYADDTKSADSKTTAEAGAKATSNSDGRGSVEGHVAVKSGDASRGGEIGARVDVSHSTEGKDTQSAEVTVKKDF